MSDEITQLRQDVEQLRARLAETPAAGVGYYDSPLVKRDWFNLRHIPELGYDDIDLQNALARHHWYVGSYRMQFEHPLSGDNLPLFRDADADACMFRIVLKSNLTRGMAEHLLASIEVALEFLDSVAARGSIDFDTHQLRHKDQRRLTNHC